MYEIEVRLCPEEHDLPVDPSKPMGLGPGRLQARGQIRNQSSELVRGPIQGGVIFLAILETSKGIARNVDQRRDNEP